MKQLKKLVKPAKSRVHMMMTTKNTARLFALVAFLFLNACATPMFNVSSEPPQADVYFQAPGSSEKKVIGKTPLALPMAELNKIIGTDVSSGQYFPVSVEKSGYITQTFQIPATRFATYVTALDVKLKEGATPREEKSAKALIESLFLAQRFALSQQFERAQIEIDSILKDFPGFARALSMRASIYYAQKNFTESLKWYEEALKSDPQMDDAVKMSAKIRSAQGLPARVPASSPGTAAFPAPAPVGAPAAQKGTAQ